MPLNKDILGTDIYNALSQFNDKSPAVLGDLETARLAFCKVLADEIIKHFISNIKLTIPATGFVSASPGSPVTGSSITGTIL